MIRVDRVDSFPSALREAFDERTIDKLRIWGKTFDTIERMSRWKYYATQNGLPILGVGALRLSFTNPAAEFWAFPTRYLGIGHLPRLREVLHAEIESERLGPLYARAENRRDAKFIEWFGGELLFTHGTVRTYEV